MGRASSSRRQIRNWRRVIAGNGEFEGKPHIRAEGTGDSILATTESKSSGSLSDRGRL